MIDEKPLGERLKDPKRRGPRGGAGKEKTKQKSLLERLKDDGFAPGPPPSDVTELPGYLALLLGAMTRQVLSDESLKPEVQLRLMVQLGDRIERLQDAAKLQATIRALRAELEQLRAEVGRKGPALVAIDGGEGGAGAAAWPPARRGRPPARSL